MKKDLSCKYFEFTKNFFRNPEKLGHYDIYQVGELELSENACIPEHRQVCHEISYILSGEGTFSTGDTNITVRSGDIHVISKNATHTISTGKNKGLRFACLGFMFNEEFSEEHYSTLQSLFLGEHKYTVHDNGEIGRLFTLLIGENYNISQNSKLACESLINCILILTERLFSGNAGQSFIPKRSENFIGQPLYGIIRFIDSNIPNCPSVSEICSVFSYSESYISHLFKGKLGMSIRDYITDSKLEYAKNLVLDEKQSIQETAHALGYSSSQSFCKSFRNKFGLSPTEYRRKYASKKAD